MAETRGEQVPFEWSEQGREKAAAVPARPPVEPARANTQAHAKAEAVLYAQDKERQAWRQREGLEPDPGEAMTFGELLDWWWDPLLGVEGVGQQAGLGGGHRQEQRARGDVGGYPDTKLK